MTNSYYNQTEVLARNTTARAETINRELTAIGEGFDKLPDPDDINAGSVTYGDCAGSSNAYVITGVTGPAAPTAGTHVSFFASFANTGAATLKYGSWDAKGLLRNDGTALVSGDIASGMLVEARYSGSYWAMVGAAFADVSAQRALAQTAATNASASASAAAGSASSASGSATSAASSATAASGSATSAAASAAAAAASSGIPPLTGHAGKVPVVNGGETALEYTALSAANVSGVLPLTGGTLSGELNLADNLLTRALVKDIGFEVSVIGNVGATRTFDITTANYFTATVDQASTFTFSNPTASGDACAFYIQLTNGGAFTVTWPGAVAWDAGEAPTLQSSGVDILGFVTTNGGTTWRGLTVWQAA